MKKDEKAERKKGILIGVILLLVAVVLLFSGRLLAKQKTSSEKNIQQKEKMEETQPEKIPFSVVDEKGILKDVTGEDRAFAEKMITEYVKREGLDANKAACIDQEPVDENVTEIHVQLDDPDETMLAVQYDAEKGSVTVLEKL